MDLLLRSNLVQRELSRMNINSLSLLDKTVQVTPQVIQMLGGLLEREVTRDDPEWTSAVASLTIRDQGEGEDHAVQTTTRREREGL